MKNKDKIQVISNFEFINQISCGEIIVASRTESMDNLIGKLKELLKDKSIRGYLEDLKERRNVGGSYFG